MGYIWLCTMYWGFPTFYAAFALTGNSNTTNVFKIKYDWDDDETKLMNTIISSSAVIGIAIGSFTGGSLIKLGRRKAALISHLLATIGAVISMFDGWVFNLAIGRFILGIAAGMYNVTFGKILTENLPASCLTKFSMSHNAMICIGYVFVFGLGLILPDPDDY